MHNWDIAFFSAASATRKRYEQLLRLARPLHTDIRTLLVAMMITATMTTMSLTSCSADDQVRSSDKNDDSSQDDLAEEQTIQVGSVSTTSLSNVPGSSLPVRFSTSSEGGVSEVSASYPGELADLLSLDSALVSIDAHNIPVGFLLVNCETGYGMSYNIDTDIYGASTFKSVFAFYVCDMYIETGRYSLDDSFVRYAESDDDDGYYIAGNASLEDLIYNSIVYSDNGSFGSLREAFGGEPFDEWLARYGASIEEQPGSWFPTYSVRNAAKLWLGLYAYLETETETSEWLESLLESTEVSFLRDALDDREDITVLDKAGWYLSEDEDNDDYNSICDSGIVTYQGNDYLFCVMTKVPYDDETVERFETLVSAIFDELTHSEQSLGQF